MSANKSGRSRAIHPPSVCWHCANKLQPAWYTPGNRRDLLRECNDPPVPDAATQAMNAPDWLAAYAEKLDVDAPTTAELKAVLELAGEAAHASERIAAPVACWLAAKAGVELDEAIRLARGVAES